MVEEITGNLSETIGEVVELAEDTIRKPFTKKLAQFGFYTIFTLKDFFLL